MSRRGQYVNDLTPFFDDGCWMFVLLARDAKVGVILRRGPTRWWHVTRWDTRTDQFEKGQWFHGRIYPDQCDLSPDGKLFVYFAGKWRARARDLGYGDVWTAVSRPPYLTALALWPDTSTYGGGGIFFDNQSVQVGWPGLHHHPDHPPGPLLVNPALVPPPPCWQEGWLPVPFVTPVGQYRKPCGPLALGRDLPVHRASRARIIYYLYRSARGPIAQFESHWADWDHRGRLVAAVGGRILTARLTKDDHLRWRQLVDLHPEKPTRLEAPAWAQRW